MGPQLGPAITAGFPEVLVALARRRAGEAPRRHARAAHAGTDVKMTSQDAKALLNLLRPLAAPR